MALAARSAPGVPVRWVSAAALLCPPVSEAAPPVARGSPPPPCPLTTTLALELDPAGNQDEGCSGASP